MKKLLLILFLTICPIFSFGQITIDSDDADIANAYDNNAMNSSKGGEASVELIYDPVLACYFDPKSGKYYEIQQ